MFAQISCNKTTFKIKKQFGSHQKLLKTLKIYSEGCSAPISNGEDFFEAEDLVVIPVPEI